MGLVNGKWKKMIRKRTREEGEVNRNGDCVRASVKFKLTKKSRKLKEGRRRRIPCKRSPFQTQVG